jgi:hypothetical protein
MTACAAIEGGVGSSDRFRTGCDQVLHRRRDPLAWFGRRSGRRATCTVHSPSRPESSDIPSSAGRQRLEHPLELHVPESNKTVEATPGSRLGSNRTPSARRASPDRSTMCTSGRTRRVIGAPWVRQVRERASESRSGWARFRWPASASSSLRPCLSGLRGLRVERHPEMSNKTVEATPGSRLGSNRPPSARRASPDRSATSCP